MQWLVRAAKCAPKRILKVWGNWVDKRWDKLCLGVRSCFESIDGALTPLYGRS